MAYFVESLLSNQTQALLSQLWFWYRLHNKPPQNVVSELLLKVLWVD